jgi:hypothetical protein
MSRYQLSELDSDLVVKILQIPLHESYPRSHVEAYFDAVLPLDVEVSFRPLPGEWYAVILSSVYGFEISYAQNFLPDVDVYFFAPSI